MNQLNLSEIIECFYKNIDTVILGKNLINTLKGILGNEFLTFSDKEIRVHIKQCYETFLKTNENILLPSNTTPSTMDRNIRNWLTDCYKGLFNNSMKSISRESILTLCFILSLNDNNCNELLFAANQHPLHYGGDAEETIITYCLKNKLDFNSAICIYFDYVNKLKEKNENKSSNEEPSYEERTNVLKNQLELTMINSLLNETRCDKIVVLINRLMLCNNGFSSSSNRTFSTLYQLKKTYSITGEEFINFYNGYYNSENYSDKNADGITPLGSFQYIKDAFYSIDNYNSTDITTQPTRFFVMLIAIYSWCNSNIKKSLSDFVDEVLFSCDFHLLDGNYNEDAFVLEISKFRYDQKISYNNNEVLLQGNYQNKKEAFSLIISSYLSKENHILSGYELTKKKQFFIFSN